MTSRTLVKRGGAATAGFALLALACGDGRAPSGLAAGALSDAANAAAHLQAIDRAVTTPALRSFAAATAHLTSLGASALAPAAALVHAARPAALEPPYARAARQAEDLRETLPLLDSLKVRSIFPPGVIGKTFVWDATLGSYRPSNRRGAPPNGVRLVLYAIDPRTQLPSSPLTEIGYADL